MSTTTTPPPLPPPDATGTDLGTAIPAEPVRRRWWMARRVLAAAVFIALLSGGATAVLALNEVNKVVEALRASKPVNLRPDTLAPTSKGAPETLLLVGNDERPAPKSGLGNAVEPHSNEMLLVRVDPSAPTISMLSIPRELQVTFTAPNGAVITNRINSAYTYGYEEGHGTTGGVQLMLETIKHVLGVVVNHVFVTNFPKFRRAVDEMGCVYMSVDRRYYHVNEPGGEQYFEINLEPGYQRLCGKQALEFVANRHEDTSLTRDARDQRFLLSVKGQYGPTALEDREKFERIFGKAVETDSALHTTDQVLQLLELLAESAGKPVRQVPFHVTLLPTFDTATPRQIEEAVHSFMRGTSAITAHAPAGLHQSHAREHGTHGRRHVSAAVASGMLPTPSAILDRARSIAADLPFPLLAPRYQFAGGETPDLLRHYDIRAPNGRLYPAYVIVVDRGGLGEYYDLEGTSWTHAPVLSNPTTTFHLGSRTYALFYDGEHIKTIAWHEGHAAYWIENTLTSGLSPRDMVEAAQETVPVIGGVGPAHGHPSFGGFVVPGRSPAGSSVSEKAGAGVALLVLAALAALSVLLLRRQRELIALREQVGHALVLEAGSRSALIAEAPAASVAMPVSGAPGQAEARLAPGGPGALLGAGPAPRRTYRAPLRRWALALTVALVLAMSAALAVYLLRADASISSAGARPLPVAVLSAAANAPQAQRVAGMLGGVVSVGRIGAGERAGVAVMYPHGGHAEAVAVAAALRAVGAHIAPIQPPIVRAVSGRKEIVVVIA